MCLCKNDEQKFVKRPVALKYEYRKKRIRITQREMK